MNIQKIFNSIKEDCKHLKFYIFSLEEHNKDFYTIKIKSTHRLNLFTATIIEKSIIFCKLYNFRMSFSDTKIILESQDDDK